MIGTRGPNQDNHELMLTEGMNLPTQFVHLVGRGKGRDRVLALKK